MDLNRQCIRFISSGIAILNDLSPASIWTIGRCSFDAATAPVMVELVSPQLTHHRPGVLVALPGKQVVVLE